MKKEDIIFIIIFGTLLISGIYYIHNREDNYEWVGEQTPHVIISKQVTNVTINNFGVFREEYKFLFENGEVHDCELEDYMSFKEGDSIVITNYVKQLKVNKSAKN